MTEIETKNIDNLRVWLKDTEKHLFSDDELELVVARYASYIPHEDEEEDPIQQPLDTKGMDLSRAECLEMIAGDIQRWTTYSAGGLSETFDKNTLLEVAARLRMRWGFSSGELIE